MDTIEIRKRIHQYIDLADERLLNLINAIITQDENTIIAYTTEGKPLTAAEYRKELDLSEKEIENGEFISQEDLEKEIEKW
jgi:hypothetical protein